MINCQSQLVYTLFVKYQPTVVENKPEAPWIKRTSEGVIFTDNVQIVEDLDLKSTTRPKETEVDDPEF